MEMEVLMDANFILATYSAQVGKLGCNTLLSPSQDKWRQVVAALLAALVKLERVAGCSTPPLPS